MTIIIGLDLSLTSTGVARLYSSEHLDGYGPETWRITSTGKRADTLKQRRARINQIAEAVLHRTDVADLVVVERMFASREGASGLDRSGLWWEVVGPIIDRGIPVIDVIGQHLKMFLTGKGNADKAAVAVAASRLWPDWVSDDGKAEDEADALGLASIGAAIWERRLAGDPPFPMTAPRENVLGKLKLKIKEAGL